MAMVLVSRFFHLTLLMDPVIAISSSLFLYRIFFRFYAITTHGHPVSYSFSLASGPPMTHDAISTLGSLTLHFSFSYLVFPFACVIRFSYSFFFLSSSLSHTHADGSGPGLPSLSLAYYIHTAYATVFFFGGFV